MRNTGVKILRIDADSPAARSGLKPGDRLLEINGHPVEDSLDLQYHICDDWTDFVVDRDGSLLNVQVDISDGTEPGWEVEPLELRRCKCNCIFCFVDQQPAGFRPSLYLKDEDYRFSFVFGNYLTLVGLTGQDFERILRLRLSPLYVSIHVTDPTVRGKLLGLKKAPVLPKLGKLIKGGIQIHGQIVVIPGFNDGDVLVDTLQQLLPLYPGLASVSVVPVGLTKHRNDLTPLRLLNLSETEQTLNIVNSFQQKALDKSDSRWVFPADELLIRAGTSFPDEEYYEDYPQIENGVGLVRWIQQRAQEALQNLKGRRFKRRLLWLTGLSAYQVLKYLADDFMNSLPGLDITVLSVENELMGDSVTVAGLLCGKDMETGIIDYLRNESSDSFDAIYLPPDCVNSDGFFLDDRCAPDVANYLNVSVEVFDGNWEKMITGEES